MILPGVLLAVKLVVAVGKVLNIVNKILMRKVLVVAVEILTITGMDLTTNNTILMDTGNYPVVAARMDPTVVTVGMEM